MVSFLHPSEHEQNISLRCERNGHHKTAAIKVSSRVQFSFKIVVTCQSSTKILDFKLIASHNESLHSHDAIAVMIKGVNGGFNDRISPNELKSLLY